MTDTATASSTSRKRKQPDTDAKFPETHDEFQKRFYKNQYNLDPNTCPICEKKIKLGLMFRCAGKEDLEECATRMCRPCYMKYKDLCAEEEIPFEHGLCFECEGINFNLEKSVVDLLGSIKYNLSALFTPDDNIIEDNVEDLKVAIGLLNDRAYVERMLWGMKT